MDDVVVAGDAAAVTRQLGRAPRGRWRVLRRCRHGSPLVIATAPVLEDGTLFPTLYYLTCPHLVAVISRMESAGAIESWRGRIATDEALAARLRAADAVYRDARAAECGGHDPVPAVGIAGQKDPLAVKCLHAHTAAALAGIDDPIGDAVLDEIGSSLDACGTGSDGSGRCSGCATDSGD